MATTPEHHLSTDEEYFQQALRNGRLPEKRGLYDPQFEHENCGVGFIAHIKGERSRKIVDDADRMLQRMEHRGACGCEENTGDGAGMLTALPFELLEKVAKADLDADLPQRGFYGTGIVNLPTDKAEREQCRKTLNDIIEAQGQKLVGWRLLPIDPDTADVGPTALACMPHFEQLFIAAGDGLDSDAFERQLFIIRKWASREIRVESDLEQKLMFYVNSLSTKVIIWKGMLRSLQLMQFYEDLQDPDYQSHLAMVHSRFSTNTFPSWDRAQPCRFMSHNGEINTLRGNSNWMFARQGVMKSDLWGDDLRKLCPIIEPECSDSGNFDNALEMLYHSGRTLQESVMMMIPEAWQNHHNMPEEKRAFYEYYSALQEPWDGPASISFTDGHYIGAVLDRNGLRPSRYYVTHDDRVIMASEVGVAEVDPKDVKSKGRLQPGRMFLVDFEEGRIIGDEELKSSVASKRPYKEWLKNQAIHLDDLPRVETPAHYPPGELLQRMQAFGFTTETLQFMLMPMLHQLRDPVGSMGNDAAMACLSDQARMTYDYFKQLFAQVTNPAIDSIREDVIMSLECCIGPEGNLLDTTEEQCHRLCVPHPILTNAELAAIRSLDGNGSDRWGKWKTKTIDITHPRSDGAAGLRPAIERVCKEATRAIDDGYSLIVLSDRESSAERVPISALLATGAVHHALVRQELRTRIGIVVESAESREVHHFCLLTGYGADAINPYLAFESLYHAREDGLLEAEYTDEKIVKSFRKAVAKGMLKVMGKMGISTLASYKGAQIFEAVGLNAEVIDGCFVGTASRIAGVGFDVLAEEGIRRHEIGFPTRETESLPILPNDGQFHWRREGEAHAWNPYSISSLQAAARTGSQEAYKEFSRLVNEHNTKSCFLRGLLRFKSDRQPVPLEEVEPAKEIVKRFCTGAMSYGSISAEAHETLAVAMNVLGGKSNTGEGGEDPKRFESYERPDDEHQLMLETVRQFDPEKADSAANQYSKRSYIKQVASGRFGVTSWYLTNADELQIKIAQGAKPGEGGELPGHKVDKIIAATRHSTPGVGLISPPPHHDIYSIEDLAQLIFDLKNSNPRAAVSVKLVSEVGVGTIAAGVAKGHADKILISGTDGGTGASPLTSIKHAGLPWELGIAETHQVLVMNDLRSRVRLETDGQVKTGRDVVVAALLGAEEFGLATAPLITMGCIMMRKCHLNTCPVGIATQDKELRKKFKGKPEHVVNYLFMVAGETREIMAELGFRTVSEMVGRVEALEIDDAVAHWKAKGIDLTPILTPAVKPHASVGTFCQIKQKHGLEGVLDNILLEECQPALKENPEKVEIDIDIVNTDRAFGTWLSNEVSRVHGRGGLPDGTIQINTNGSAGQSVGAWLAPGVTIELEGDANDYAGKGLSGGHLIVYPPKASTFAPEENIITGNVALYGATAGEAYFRGMAAERFCVRNSGADAVIEGVGDHALEYMTGGRAVILGPTGRNFAAGMSGGVAYVLAEDKEEFRLNCNLGLVDLEKVETDEDIAELKNLIEKHTACTGSTVASGILDNWTDTLPKFIKVMPRDYKRAMAEIAAEQEAEAVGQPQEIVVSLKREGPMGDPRGFMTVDRETYSERDPVERIADWDEFHIDLPIVELQKQGSRCMDCGVPFCHTGGLMASMAAGCPVQNLIPEWNDLVFRGHWREALDRLHKTNNFPEFTGRVCPAPCEGSCVLGISEPAVTIKQMECSIVDRGFSEGWIEATAPACRTGKTVAVVGSGPAGLACAAQLNKAGHTVTVFERADRIGGLLMYGIPNMKLEKERVVQRRIDLMADEGVIFKTGVEIGKGLPAQQLVSDFDAVVLSVGATKPNDFFAKTPGRDLNGIHFAMEFLTKNTKSLLDSRHEDGQYINAAGQDVIVIGGGDTGTDCIGTSLRHGCRSLVTFEIVPQPPDERAANNPWPQWPRILYADYGHIEAAAKFDYSHVPGKQLCNDPREFSIQTAEFLGDDDGNLRAVKTVRVDWSRPRENGPPFSIVEGSEQEWPCQLIFLALGFSGPEQFIADELNLETDRRSNFQADYGHYATSIDGVFAAGDCRRGQSLVVWAINEGREAARECDRYLMGSTKLP